MTYSEGLWHAILGLDPQYDHMKGYNEINNKDKEIKDKEIKDNEYSS